MRSEEDCSHGMVPHTCTRCRHSRERLEQTEELDALRAKLAAVTRERDELRAKVEVLTSPRAVLGEAERLLRERKVEHVDFHYECLADNALDGVVVEAGERHGIDSKLADAYEALADGKASP